jgi:hypothetical protein
MTRLLVLDRLPVHRARPVRDWLAERRAEIEVSYLPPYGSDLDPDEVLDADPKPVVTRKAPACGKPRPKRAVVGHMRRPSKMPTRIRSYLRHPQLRYAT